VTRHQLGRKADEQQQHHESFDQQRKGDTAGPRPKTLAKPVK